MITPTQSLNVLVGCEESGVVRRAFAALGHNAWSNDIIPARDNSQNHLQMDIFEALDYLPWDIIILHPPCTALCVSGNSTYGTGMPKHPERIAAKTWTKNLWEKAKLKARIGVALENPVGVVWKALGVTPQYIQPWGFGHPEQKKTGIALHNLPKLKSTKSVYREMMQLPKNKRERIHYMPPSPERAKLRSETFQGIAEAMANQWGNYDQR